MQTHNHKMQDPAELAMEQGDRFAEVFDAETDFVAEELLENITDTPIGRLLKLISHLPEIRQDKVVEVRRRLDQDEYDTGEKLDIALDRVLEEFIAEG